MGTEAKDRLRKIANFGGNVGWYSTLYTPASEDDVLDILARHHNVTVRAIGSGHSWSDVAANSEIALDMSALNSVAPLKANGENLVRVGAGCRLQDLLDRLHAATDRTLPTLGAIKKQTVSGAISTGTHGSGRQSLSHFVAAVRAVVFDAETGRPVIREFTDGPELLAARCGLGCFGVILSVDLHSVPKYLVAETLRACHSIEQIIAAFADNPLSNFVVWPYSATLLMFERKALEYRKLTLGEKIKARLFRAFGLLVQDTGFHIGLHAARKLGPKAIKAYLRGAPVSLSLIRDRERIDDAEHVLTNYHYLFRHEEMEIFVGESELARAIGFLRAAIESFAAIDSVFPEEFLDPLTEAGLDRVLKAKRGSYTHHYPLFCRRILPEETMISMAASALEPMYSISIFNYDRPGRRDAYYTFCRFLAHALRKLVNAKLHWGKHFPFEYGDVAPLYPRLEEFRALCLSHDRNGVLRNGYTKRVLNLPPGPAAR